MLIDHCNLNLPSGWFINPVIIFAPDIHLIFNLVDSSMSFRSAESWTPICLPKFNDTGFLHAYVSFLPNNSPACLLLLSTDKEQFFELKECKERIIEVCGCGLINRGLWVWSNK